MFGYIVPYFKESQGLIYEMRDQWQGLFFSLVSESTYILLGFASE